MWPPSVLSMFCSGATARAVQWDSRRRKWCGRRSWSRWGQSQMCCVFSGLRQLFSLDLTGRILHRRDIWNTKVRIFFTSTCNHPQLHWSGIFNARIPRGPWLSLRAGSSVRFDRQLRVSVAMNPRRRTAGGAPDGFGRQVVGLLEAVPAVSDLNDMMICLRFFLKLKWYTCTSLKSLLFNHLDWNLENPWNGETTKVSRIGLACMCVANMPSFLAACGRNRRYETDSSRKDGVFPWYRTYTPFPTRRRMTYTLLMSCFATQLKLSRKERDPIITLKCQLDGWKSCYNVNRSLNRQSPKQFTGSWRKTTTFAEVVDFLTFAKLLDLNCSIFFTSFGLSIANRFMVPETGSWHPAFKLDHPVRSLKVPFLDLLKPTVLCHDSSSWNQCLVRRVLGCGGFIRSKNEVIWLEVVKFQDS